MISEHRPNARRGFTIVELLMLMSIISVVLGMTVIQIQLLMRLDQEGRVRIEQSTNRERLGRQLRQDIHEARMAERFVDKKIVGLRISPLNASSGHLIEYRIESKRIVRFEQAKGKPAIREVYAFPRLIDAQFDIRSERGRTIVAFDLKNSTFAKNTDSPPRTDEILAALGSESALAPSSPKGAQP